MSMRKIGEDTRGQQLTLGTIIAIVLGITVLIFLIFGFSTGFGNLLGFVNKDSNVDALSVSCSLACSQLDQHSYCNQERTVKLGEQGERSGVTCAQLAKGLEGSGDDLVAIPSGTVDACGTICDDA